MVLTAGLTSAFFAAGLTFLAAVCAPLISAAYFSISAILSGITVTSLSYYLNSTFTFSSKNIERKIALNYHLLYVCSILIHSLAIFIFTSVFNFAHEIVAGMSLIIISLSLFLIQKFYLFNK